MALFGKEQPGEPTRGIIGRACERRAEGRVTNTLFGMRSNAQPQEDTLACVALAIHYIIIDGHNQEDPMLYSEHFVRELRHHFGQSSRISQLYTNPRRVLLHLGPMLIGCWLVRLQSNGVPDFGLQDEKLHPLTDARIPDNYDEVCSRTPIPCLPPSC